jgi:high-affinity K+ transport system ATPase subunit B
LIWAIGFAGMVRLVLHNVVGMWGRWV